MYLLWCCEQCQANVLLGWTSKDGREFVAIGQQDGAAFAEITKEGKLSYLGRLPQYSTPSTWYESPHGLYARQALTSTYHVGAKSVAKTIS